MHRAGLLAVALLLAGCGAHGEDPRLPRMDAVGSPAEDFLQVVVDRGDGSGPETWTLVCDGQDSGAHADAHPDAGAACARLAAMDDPFAPLAEDVACTQQYGGPQTAHVLGRWAGEDVDVALSRTDGCRIAQWDGLGPLLPVR
jgi:hypothetical protein